MRHVFVKMFLAALAADDPDAVGGDRHHGGSGCGGAAGVDRAVGVRPC